MIHVNYVFFYVLCNVGEVYFRFSFQFQFHNIYLLKTSIFISPEKRTIVLFWFSFVYSG